MKVKKCLFVAISFIYVQIFSTNFIAKENESVSQSSVNVVESTQVKKENVSQSTVDVVESTQVEKESVSQSAVNIVESTQVEKENDTVIELPVNFSWSDLWLTEQQIDWIIANKNVLEEDVINKKTLEFMVKNYWSKKQSRSVGEEDNTGYNGLYNSLSDREKEFVIKNPIAAYYINIAAKNAYFSALENYPESTSQWNDEADAYRHAYWNALGVKYLFGYFKDISKSIEVMKEFGDAHESKESNSLEVSMDLFNNKVGLDVGAKYIENNIRSGDISDNAISELIKECVTTGQLKMIKDGNLIRTGNFKKNGEWVKEGGNWYYYDSNSDIVRNQWKLISGKYYYFDKDGIMQTGWLKDNSNWYYLNMNGDMVIGWKEINNIWYYFNKNGEMQTGWVQLNGTWYYFDNERTMKVNWQNIGNKWYYFNQNGEMLTGFQKIGNKYYYLSSDGDMQTGWILLNDEWYYFNSSGAMVTGWDFIENDWYYFSVDGVMLEGWQYINGQWYYFNENGKMQTGWNIINGKTYYMENSGTMVTGYQFINGRTYHFASSGELLMKSPINNPDKPSILPAMLQPTFI